MSSRTPPVLRPGDSSRICPTGGWTRSWRCSRWGLSRPACRCFAMTRCFSIAEAEAKKRNGDLPDDYTDGVLTPFVESMAQEIGRALQFFFTSTPYNRVDYIMLAGGSAALPGLTEAVTQHTSFACSVLNPFDGMEIAGTVREKKML